MVQYSYHIYVSRSRYISAQKTMECSCDKVNWLLWTKQVIERSLLVRPLQAVALRHQTRLVRLEPEVG